MASEEQDELDEEVSAVMKNSNWLNSFWDDLPGFTDEENAEIRDRVYKKVRSSVKCRLSDGHRFSQYTPA